MAEAKVTAPGSTGTNEFGDLREAQLAHEGMKLILCSKLTDAERFFSKYRWDISMWRVQFASQL